MTRTELRTFIRDGVSLIAPSHWYGSGRITELNSAPDIELPFTWLISPESAPELPTETGAPFDDWAIELHIGKQDTTDSIYTQYEQLIDDCDIIARQLQTYYRTTVTGYELATLTLGAITPFIKEHSFCATGVILTFTINAPDTTNYCTA